MALIQSPRLETVLGAPVDKLSHREIAALPLTGATESFDLDFKSVAYGSSDKERRDLCADVAALANSAGGVIIIGIEEDAQARASATPGVSVGDAERNRMLQIVASGVAPVPALQIDAVPSEDDPTLGWFVIQVPRSTRAPHAVIVNEGLRFPVRNGTTTRYLSEPEIGARYRQRFDSAHDLDARLSQLASGALEHVNLEFGPWLLIVLVPEHSGSLEISQVRLSQMRQMYESKDLFDTGGSGAGFRWVRTARGRFTLGDGPYPNMNPALSHYGYAELHTDGSGTYAVEQPDIEELRRRHSVGRDDTGTDQMVSDEMVALSILTGLRRLAAHARDTTGAAGAATLQVHLVPSPGRAVEIGHSRRWTADSRSGNAVNTTAHRRVRGISERPRGPWPSPRRHDSEPARRDRELLRNPRDGPVQYQR